MEYVILTAFILISVAIIFTFSFVNYTQNVKIAKTNEAMSKIANAVNEVYVRGEGNTRFVNFSAISMEVQLLGGNKTMLKETKASIFEDIGEMGLNVGILNKYSGSAYAVRISWTNTGLIKLEKV